MAFKPGIYRDKKTDFLLFGNNKGDFIFINSNEVINAGPALCRFVEKEDVELLLEVDFLELDNFLVELFKGETND